MGGYSPTIGIIGAVLVMGVAYLLAQGLADHAPEVLTRRMAAYSVATTLSYFALQSVTIWLTTGALPATPAPGPLQWALMVMPARYEAWYAAQGMSIDFEGVPGEVLSPITKSRK